MRTRKKLSKRMDYPQVVFLQMNRINKMMSEERMSWQTVKMLERALHALECNIKVKTDNLNESDFKDLMEINKCVKDISNDYKKADIILEKLIEKYTELNKLAEKIGLMGMYFDEGSTMSPDE